MKKIICFLLVLSMLAVLAGCGKKEPPIERIDSDVSDVKIDERVLLESMSEAEFRRFLKPYLETWYNISYRALWCDAFTISADRETVTDEDGAEYAKLEDFNSKKQLSDYLSKYLDKALFEDLLEESTYEKDGKLYVIELGSGWYGVPDFYSCKLLSYGGDTYKVGFSETWELETKTMNYHVLNFGYSDGHISVLGALSQEEAFAAEADGFINGDITWDIMTEAEFRTFVAIFINKFFASRNDCNNYDYDSIERCPDRETEGCCVASVCLDGEYCYITLSGDSAEDFGIVDIQRQ